MEFSLHPNIYSSGGAEGLRPMLEETWVRTHRAGDGTIYILSGFANYNGGARFYRAFKEHTEMGGRIVAFLGGSAQQRLSSRQVVTALLECGAEVYVINRKKLLHAKCYGVDSSRGQSLIVTSGNFTAPGMSQNVEAALKVEGEAISNLSFRWTDLESQLHKQDWFMFRADLAPSTEPGWQLLYDETPGKVRLDKSEEVTLVILLGHADTARIQAEPGTDAGKGSQYFWLSKDNFDFFPPLTIQNERGYKGTLSTLVKMHYVQLDTVAEDCRVTFEAENNLDFRLGTGPLRYTSLAASGDIACISRVGEEEYQLRIVNKSSSLYDQLARYAMYFVGSRGKRYGYIDNDIFFELVT